MWIQELWLLLFYRACLQYLRLLPELVTRDLTLKILASASDYISVGLLMGLIFEIAPYWLELWVCWNKALGLILLIQRRSCVSQKQRHRNVSFEETLLAHKLGPWLWDFIFILLGESYSVSRRSTFISAEFGSLLFPGGIIIFYFILWYVWHTVAVVHSFSFKSVQISMN